MLGPNSCAKWLQELHRLCGLTSADQGMEWRGESFYWLPACDLSPDHIKVYGWVGPLSDQVKIDALKQLLWMQLQSLGPCSPSFGCEPESSDLVIAQAIPWKEIDPAKGMSLLGLLADLAGQSRALLQSKTADKQTQPVSVKTGSSPRALPRWWLPQPSEA